LFLRFADVQPGSNPFPRVGYQVSHDVGNCPVFAELRFGLEQEAGGGFLVHEGIVDLGDHGLHVGFGHGDNQDCECGDAPGFAESLVFQHMGVAFQFGTE
jgi:hypothetical protein